MPVSDSLRVRSVYVLEGLPAACSHTRGCRTAAVPSLLIKILACQAPVPFHFQTPSTSNLRAPGRTFASKSAALPPPSYVSSRRRTSYYFRMPVKTRHPQIPSTTPTTEDLCTLIFQHLFIMPCIDSTLWANVCWHTIARIASKIEAPFCFCDGMVYC